MDFFERAHVSTKEMKPIKEQGATKKQLKLMLQGYKTSDNELIKEAESLAIDDSSSVSGFSDLNLTASSDEDNCNPKKILLSQHKSSISDNESELDQSISRANEISVSSSYNNSISKESTTTDDNLIDSITSISFVNTNESMNTDSNSISGYDGDMASFSDISLISVNSAESLNSSDTSVIGSSLSEFDPTGELALKIREKLSQNHQENRNVVANEPHKHIGDKKNKKETQKKKKIDIKSKSIKKEKHIKQKTKLEKDSKVDLQYEETVSSPFVSISATDLQEQSFNQVLGDYKHSTIRNLPSDNHSTLITSDSSTFPVEVFSSDLNIRNIDEVSSLIPEVDNDLSVSDLVEIDTNSSTIQDSFNLNDMSTTDPIEIDSALDVTQNVVQSNVVNYKVYFGNNNCVIVLKHPAELYIHGKVLVKALGGLVEVFGHTLTEQECPIVAPLYTYAQCFKTVESNTNYKHLFTKLTEARLLFHEIEEIVVNMGKSDGILLLKPLKCPKMDFVAENFTHPNLFKNNHREKELERAANFLGCTMYSTRPQKFFQENLIWERVLPCNESPTIGIACGGKGSGKSTFLRYYVNKLLHKSQVLVIDLDPGQSEFTVAGNVSATVVNKPIFGPSFTHLKKPNKCLNIGIISTMDNIQRYVNAVKSIISYSRDNFSNIPWVINTMGMTNAVGLKFMALIISLVQPDFVLQYDSKNPKKCFEIRLTSVNVTDLLSKYKYDKIFSNVETNVKDYSLIMAPEAEMLAPNKSSIIPRDERYLNFLAYFAELADDFNIKSSSLLGVIPYEVKLKDLYIGLNVKLKDDNVTKVINGKVVALCQQTIQCRARVFTLADKPLLCHGHGLIRGIDWENEVLYVITPLSGHELRSVNTLVYADWVPELRGQEAHLPDGTEVPYRTSAQHEQTKLMAAPKRRFNPLLFLKMTRNT